MQVACRATRLRLQSGHPLPPLQIRAQAHRRSLSQQALADLEAIAGGDSRERRRQVLDRMPSADQRLLRLAEQMLP